MDDLINQNQHELYEIKNAISMKEKNIEFTRHQISVTTERKQKNFSEIEIWRTRKNDLVAETENLKKVLAEAENRIGVVKKEYDVIQQRLEDLVRADQEVNNHLEEQKIIYIDRMMEKSRLNNMVSGLEKNIEDLLKREERENRELEEDGKMMTDWSVKYRMVHQQLKQNEEEIVNLVHRKAVAEEEMERFRNELQMHDERIAEIKEEISLKSSRLASLKEFQETYKWCHESIQTIIADREHKEKFCGVVADHISVPREYETAVEAVLGEKLQYVVVKNQEDGVRAIDYLKSNQLGRGSFVSVDLRKNYYAQTYSEEHLNEAEPLLEKIKVHEDYRTIIDCLLGDVLLIPNIENGIALWKRNGFMGTFVTPDGDMISPNGVLTGGSKTATEKSLLATKREIGELESEVAQLNVDLQENVHRKSALVLTIARWEEEFEKLKTDIHALEIAINIQKKDLERSADEIEKLKQRIAVLEFNSQNLKSEKSEAENRLRQFRTEILQKEAAEAQINEVIAALNVQRENARLTMTEYEHLLTDKKVELASLEEKKEAYGRTLSRLQNDIISTENEMKAKEAEIMLCDHQLVELSRTIEDEQSSLGSLYQKFTAKEKFLQDQKAEQNREEAQLQLQESEIREVKNQLDGLRQQLNETEIAYREIVLNKENLRRAIGEKFHDIDLENRMSEFEKIDDQKQAELMAFVEKNKQVLDTFGQVNLLALEEYGELDKRYTFLTTQITDLNASLNVLQRTITRINKISRTRFAETFEAVNQCFKDVFAQMFPGGRGELVLTDEDDLLETGVDIDVQVPGKRKQNVSLLSGGEKSLVAVALIFAILKYRPSPFLVLDEVDAALDDANTNLFNRLIKDVSRKSQVVMITHNKSTMEVADTLFGVTMQKQGISTLVSVSLN